MPERAWGFKSPLRHQLCPTAPGLRREPGAHAQPCRYPSPMAVPRRFGFRPVRNRAGSVALDGRSSQRQEHHHREGIDGRGDEQFVGLIGTRLAACQDDDASWPKDRSAGALLAACEPQSLTSSASSISRAITSSGTGAKSQTSTPTLTMRPCWRHFSWTCPWSSHMPSSTGLNVV